MVSESPPSQQRLSRVPVDVTGVVLRRGQEVEICPGASFQTCAGIRVVGDVAEEWFSTPTRVSVWRLTGSFDGSTLELTGLAQATDLAAPVDYSNPCSEFQQRSDGGNHDEALSTAVASLRRTYAERVAGNWWDAARGTMIVWVKGDAADVQRTARAQFPRARICIKGEARFSEAELESARSRADRILTEGRSAWSSSSLDVVRNRVVYEIEVLDAPTAQRLKQEVGEAVLAVPFIQMRQHALSQLPSAAARGDVPLVTSNTRSSASMAALGRFSVHYDPALHCFYLENSERERFLPVWPLGFWATKSPMRIFDYDGNAVAATGTMVEFGGGMVDIAHVRAENACGAKSAWIGKPVRAQQPP
jgi:hypothetical protein